MRNICWGVFTFTCIALLYGCSGNLYFGTATSVGLDVSGTSKVPNKISFAFDRSEIAIVPNDSSGHPHSVFASLDSEWTWFSGFYVTQNFATGEAADIVAKQPPVTVNYAPATSPASTKPLVFTTGTKLGIGIEFGQTTSAPMSLLVGYRRAEMTLMPDVASKAKIAPVFADISIVSSDSAPTNLEQVPSIGGVRIKQRFAVGTAAVNAASIPEMGDKLRKAVYGDPTIQSLEIAKNRFDKERAILAKFSSMDSTNKKIYLNVLNQIFGKTPANLITSDNLQTELGNLTDIQLNVASEQIKTF